MPFPRTSATNRPMGLPRRGLMGNVRRMTTPATNTKKPAAKKATTTKAPAAKQTAAKATTKPKASTTTKASKAPSTTNGETSTTSTPAPSKSATFAASTDAAELIVKHDAFTAATEAFESFVCELITAGTSPTAIGKAIGLGNSSVRRIAMRRGLDVK